MKVLLFFKTEDRHLSLNLRVCYKDTDGIYNKTGIIASKSAKHGSIEYELDNSMGLYLADELKLIMPDVDVKFKNSKYNYSTSVSFNTSRQDALKYFVGSVFNMGEYPKENLQRCVSIKYNNHG